MSINPLKFYNPSEGLFLKVEKGQLVPHQAPQWAEPIFREFLHYLNTHTELLDTKFPHREELLSRIHLYSSRKGCSIAEKILFKKVFKHPFTPNHFERLIVEQKWIFLQRIPTVAAIVTALPFLDKAKDYTKFDLIKRLHDLDESKRNVLIHLVQKTIRLGVLPANCEISYLYLLLPLASEFPVPALRVAQAIYNAQAGTLRAGDVQLYQRIKEHHPLEMERGMRELPLEEWEIDYQIDMIPILPPDKIISIVDHMSPIDSQTILDEEHEYDGESMHILQFFQNSLINLAIEGEDTICDMVQNALPNVYLGQRVLVARQHPEYLLPYLQDMDEESRKAVMPFMPPATLLQKFTDENTPLPRVTDIMRYATIEMKTLYAQHIDITTYFRNATTLSALQMQNHLVRNLLSALKGENTGLKNLLGAKEKERIYFFENIGSAIKVTELRSAQATPAPQTPTDVITLEPTTRPILLPDSANDYIDITTIPQLTHVTIDSDRNWKIAQGEHRDAKGNLILEPVKLRLENSPKECYYVALQTLRSTTMLILHPLNRQLYLPSAFKEDQPHPDETADT